MLEVGPRGVVEPSGNVMVPEKRPGERTVVVDVINVYGAAKPAGRAFFRAMMQPGGEREVFFKFMEPKAIHLRPALQYVWRIEVPYRSPSTIGRGAPIPEEAQPLELVKPGQVIPGSMPEAVAEEPLRIWRGRFPLLVQDMIIQIDDRVALADVRMSSETELSQQFGDYVE